MKRVPPAWLAAAIAGLLLMGSLGLFTLPASAQQGPRQVLILNSYHPGFGWSDREMQGVIDALPADVAVTVEYLDTRRHPLTDAPYMALLHDQIAYKYEADRFDCIIVLDDGAFDFLMAYQEELFPGTPIVFGGLPSVPEDQLAGHEHITGVLGRIDQAGTLAVALRFHPDTEQILVVTDPTARGRANRAALDALAQQGQIGAELVYLDPTGEGLTLDDLLNRLADAPPHSIVYYSDFSQDRNGQPQPFAETVPQLSAASTAPIYVHNELYLGYGVVGGSLISGRLHGDAVGQLATRVLNGEPPESIPIQFSPNIFMFDYPQLVRWGIPLAALPEGSIVINHPVPIHEQYPELVWGTAAFAILQSAIIALLILNVVRRRQTVKTLRQSEERYRRLVEHAPIPIMVHHGGRVAFLNPAARRTLGFAPDEDLAGRSVWDFVHPDYQDLVRSRVKAVYEQKEVGALIEEKFIRSNDSVIDVEVTGVPTQYMGQPASLVIFQDITERKRSEQALSEQQQLIERITDAMPSILYVVEVPSGRLLYVNAQAIAMMGYTSEQITVSTFSPEAFLHPNDQTRAGSFLSMISSARDGEIIEDEFRLKHANGEWRWFSSRDVVFSRHPDGSVRSHLGIATDITERKRAEAALRQHAERLRILLDVDQAILEAQFSDVTAQAALRHMRELVPCWGAWVVMLNLADREAVLTVSDVEQSAAGTRFFLGQLPNIDQMVDTIRQEKLFVIDDVQAMAQIIPDLHRLYAHGLRTIFVLPIMFQKELFGLLALGMGNQEALSEEQIQIAREVADKLAIAIQQTRLLEAEHKQRTLAEALRDTAAAINSSLDLDAVLNSILDNADRVVPHDAATIMLVEAGVARIVGRRGYAERGLEEAALAMRYPIASTPNLRQMIETGSPLIIPNVEDYPGWVLSDSSNWIRSYVGAPIRLEEQVIGFLNLDSATPGFFTPDYAERLQVFANQAAIAIRNAQLYEAEQKRRHIAETLRRAAAVLNSTLELDEVLDLILRQLRDVIDYDTATVQGLETGYLTILAAQGFPRPERVVGLHFPVEPKFPNMQVVTQKKPLAIADVTQEYPHFHDESTTYESGHIRSWLGVPLVVKDQIIGMITLDRMTVWPYTEEDIDLATAFANQAAIAIENASLLRSTRERASRLELVGRVGRQATAILDLDALLHQAVDLISETFGYYYTNILLVEGPDLVLRAATIPALRQMEGQIRLRVGEEGITGWVAAHGMPLLVPDVSRDPRYFSASVEEQVTRSELAVPIMLRDEVLGVLNMESSKLNDFTAADLATIQTIADQLAVAINNAQLYAQVQRHAAELEGRVDERTAELRTAYERLQELSQVKDDFVSNVSHELRTPISNLKLYHRLLELKPEKFTDYLDTLTRETRRLEDLIEALLLLSRLDQDRVSITLEPADLNALGQEYVTDRASLAESKGLTLTFEAAPALPVTRVDRHLIGQVLSILLTNAFNYTPAGGKVSVSTQVKHADRYTQVGFTVRDTGPGIPADDLPHMFERFYRGKIGRESNVSGTGLGLAIAREIVDRHGGDITAYSEGVPGKGATFTVWLPAWEKSDARQPNGAHSS